MVLLNTVTLLSLLVTVITAKYSPELRLQLSNGSPVLGQYMTSHEGHGIRGFTNIPYAEAPIGPLRFADPVPKAPWTEELPIASNAMIVCPQEDILFYGGMYLGREDCLYLNVYVPMNPKTKGPLPVMFYIHGGGFNVGNGGQFLYGPEFLLEEDVILVAGNYRLGALGFLTTFTEDFPGNNGLKDQALMLQWIQDNIAQFGGDPNRVTIFGESAGAASVGYHLLSPKTKGLFHGAILQSGSPYDNWSNVSHAQTLQFAHKMFDSMGCTYAGGDYKSTLQCLRGKNEKEFVTKMKDFMVWGHHPIVVFSPVKEENANNPFVTAEDYAQGAIGGDVPVMMGMVANEGAIFGAFAEFDKEGVPALEQNFDTLMGSIFFVYDRFGKEEWPEKLALIKQRYFNGQDFSWPVHKRGLIDLGSEISFLPGLSQMLRQRLKGTAPTFVYKFNYRGSASFTDIPLRRSKEEINMGVCHMDDLLYLFPQVTKVMRSRVMTEEDHKVRKQMVKMWVNFATNRNPSSKNVKWNPITQFPIDYMRIGNCNLDICEAQAHAKVMSAMETGFFEDGIAFMDNLHFGGSAVNVKGEL